MKFFNFFKKVFASAVYTFSGAETITASHFQQSSIIDSIHFNSHFIFMDKVLFWGFGVDYPISLNPILLIFVALIKGKPGIIQMIFKIINLSNFVTEKLVSLTMISLDTLR